MQSPTLLGPSLIVQVGDLDSEYGMQAATKFAELVAGGRTLSGFVERREPPAAKTNDPVLAQGKLLLSLRTQAGTSVAQEMLRAGVVRLAQQIKGQVNEFLSCFIKWS